MGRKKMQSMKAETDELYAKIEELQEATREANSTSERFDMDIRDTGKKVGKFETNLEEIMEKLMQSSAKMDEAEKEFKDKDDDVNAQSRRVLLLEEECRISVEKLATTVFKLATMSKDADNNLREARKIASDNEMKYDNLARSLAMMEDELK